MDRTLLLVDDEPKISRSLKRLLRGDGYRIFEADSAAQGLAILRRESISVVITDQRMPNMSGAEFLVKIQDLYPDTLRILLSGYADFPSLVAAVNEGAIYKFMAKPWDNIQLRMQVHEAFEWQKLQWQNHQLHEIFNTTIESIVITDTTGKIESVNPAFARLSGYQTDELLGRNMLFDLFRPEEKKKTFKIQQALQRNGEWHGELWCYHRDGSRHPHWLTLTMICDGDGVSQYYAAGNAKIVFSGGEICH